MPESRLKILHTGLSLEPGGMENGLVNVAGLLDPAAFDVHVCCLERRGSFADRLPNPANVTVLDKPQGFSWPTVLGLAKVIWRLEPDVIHSHNLGPLVYSVAATGLGMWRPILHGEHGQLINEQLTPPFLKRRRHYYRACRKVHTVSNSLRLHLIGLGFAPEKIISITNGVDTSRFTPVSREAARQKLNLPTAGPFIGIVGRFEKNKRHADLFEAFAKLVQRIPTAQMLVVGGGGPENDRIIALGKASPAAGQIHFTGFQSDPRPYYQAMDLLASPSFFEGLSNAVLEAMACGVPALCHNACGNTEVVTNDVDGFVADLTSVDRLALRLGNILADPSRLAEVSRKARAKVEKDFSITSMVRGYEKVYRELAGRSGMPNGQ